MVRRTIELEENQVQALERLAATERRSVEDLVRQAIDGYLTARQRDPSDWGRRWNKLVAQVQAHVPPGVTEADVDADITAARAEVRAARAARRAVTGVPDPGCR